MEAQTFLYWSLGIGFAVLVVFLCVALIQLIRILRDFADTSASVKETAEKMHDSINRIADSVTEATEQITEYVVKPFSLIHFLTDKVKPLMDLVQKKSEKFADMMEDDEEEEEEKPKRRRRRAKRTSKRKTKKK